MRSHAVHERQPNHGAPATPASIRSRLPTIEPSQASDIEASGGIKNLRSQTRHEGMFKASNRVHIEKSTYQ
ncbi:hypothetical protein C7S18_17030 [Ahniella affigens]|uniref:Uncharacterized protein n=1 Tax=Ahniella affigens TaxID=2021234 RepID=A0A2P1PVC8_9GAMM|nr:hypothetical protein C7S18_17030 [Ahniella affigens]